VHRRIVRRHHRRISLTTVTYLANRTVSSLPATVSLKLAGLVTGMHTLRVKMVFRETVRRHGRRVTISVTRTLSQKFPVC
jgi:hypothetical protein